MQSSLKMMSDNSHGELNEISEFLKEVRPFEYLPQDIIKSAANRLQIVYFRRGQTIFSIGDDNDHLHIVRTGAVEILDKEGVLISRVHEKGIFSYLSLLNSVPVRYKIRALEDCLLYRLDKKTFERLCDEYRQFKDYFLLDDANRLRSAIARMKNSHLPEIGRLSIAVKKLMSKSLIHTQENVCIQDAAKIMAKHKVSTIVILDQMGALQGIVTDRDFRNRVIAMNFSLDEPIKKIMTKEAVTIQSDATAIQANICMMNHQIHHLPVIKDEKVVGLISSTDLLKHFNQSGIYTSSQIGKAKTVEELVNISGNFPNIFQQLFNSGHSVNQIGEMMSSLADKVTITAIKMAENQLSQNSGSPPVDYVWLSAGSLSRNEQLLNSDQDNMIILSNEFDVKKHDVYFKKLSERVCEILNACGYVYCPGDVMAQNPKWRVSLNQWKNYFDRWIEQPDEKALMHCSIFFDMRVIYGKGELFGELQSHYFEKIKNNSLFFAYLTANALTNKPPIGFFRRLVLINDKQHEHQLDLKKTGTAPIVDIARVHALKCGSKAVNTIQRLKESAKGKQLSKELADDLLDAYDFINRFRIQHQVSRLSANKKVDNYANPDELSSFERDHLRDAFNVVRQAQQYLAQRYNSNQLL